MASISDIIEEFILDAMGKSSSLSFSRNDLASHFSCVPSQINYVLATRFAPSRGFLVESQRGGGGYIKISKLNFSGSSQSVNQILALIDEQLSFKQAQQILALLEEAEIIDAEQKQVSEFLLSDKSLANPFKLQPNIRANMLKELIYNLLKER